MAESESTEKKKKKKQVQILTVLNPRTQNTGICVEPVLADAIVASAPARYAKRNPEKPPAMSSAYKVKSWFQIYAQPKSHLRKPSITIV